MAKIRRTTARKDLLNIMRDSYLFSSNKEARYYLGAVCVALRNWLIAMTSDPPKELMSRLTIPGVGAIRVAWYAYDRYAPKVVVRFSPTSKVRQQIRALNKREWEIWTKGITPQSTGKNRVSFESGATATNKSQRQMLPPDDDMTKAATPITSKTC
jgi:hypothetical protein